MASTQAMLSQDTWSVNWEQHCEWVHSLWNMAMQVRIVTYVPVGKNGMDWDGVRFHQPT